MKSAVIFDFEGTLVDFQWRLGPAQGELRRAFAEQGCEVDGNYAEMWNAAVDRAMAQGRLQALRRALYPVYDRWDADALTRWSPRPGAAELLGRLADAGVRAAMVSNVGHAALDLALERFGLRPRLWPIFGREDVVHLKPHPDGVTAVLATLGTTPADALFVGDSLADVSAAREAGMRVAIVRGGEGDEATFATARPDFMVTRLDEVDSLIE